jgi:hypothetical protein
VRRRRGAAARPAPPRGEWPADYADLDRAVCAAGVKRFLRPAAPGEWPAGGKSPAWVLVEELAPGLRIRTGREVCWPGDN